MAVYERRLPVGVERVWENVRDWEHLPWLHGSSFSSIALEAEGAFGWRASIGLQGGARIRLELVIDADVPRYVSRTLEGPGAGSEIWTEVDARSEDETRVRVSFWVPGPPDAPELPPERAAALGRGYLELYTRLWDEDESMMVERARAMSERRGRSTSRPRSVDLGPLAELRSQLPRVVRFGGEPFRIVEVDGVLHAHAVRCPHRLGPLDEADVVEGRVACPWHGYAFDVASGRECGGRRLRLAPPPRVLVDPENGEVYLAAADA